MKDVRKMAVKRKIKVLFTVNRNEWHLKTWADWTADEIVGVAMLKITYQPAM